MIRVGGLGRRATFQGTVLAESSTKEGSAKQTNQPKTQTPENNQHHLNIFKQPLGFASSVLQTAVLNIQGTNAARGTSDQKWFASNQNADLLRGTEQLHQSQIVKSSLKDGWYIMDISEPTLALDQGWAYQAQLMLMCLLMLVIMCTMTCGMLASGEEKW